MISLARLAGAPIAAAERGWLPDPLIRAGIRGRVARRASQEAARSDADIERTRTEFADGPITLATAEANEQHYEVPPEFFACHLGPRLKYSCCNWDDGVASLEEAERRTLALVTERAQIEDGMRVLDLGCGWGSLSLWIAEHFPHCEVTAVSNSAPQGEWIATQRIQRGLSNVTHHVAEIGSFTTEGGYDRVTSIEMFEHVRNWPTLLARVGNWLRPDGRAFIHVFCHARATYPFDSDRAGDWMSKRFFSGGMMPSFDHLARSLTNLRVDESWRVNGSNYERTSNAWLERLDANRDLALAALANDPSRSAERWFNSWRIFYMAVAELFGYRDGEEWLVGHYRLAPEPGA